MKLACLMIVTLFTMLSNGFAGEYHSRECRFSFDIERVSVTTQGIFFKTKKFGEISLGNLNFDEKGYFSLWQAAVICTDCKEEYAGGKYVCEHCGSEEKTIIRLDNPDGNEYPISDFIWVLETAQKFERNKYDFQDVSQKNFMTQHDELLAEAYKDSQIGTDILGMIFDAGINADNKGVSVDANVSDTIEDEDGNDCGMYRFKGGVGINEDGEATYQFEARYIRKF